MSDREERAEEARERAMNDPAFRAGYDAWQAWESGPPCSLHAADRSLVTQSARQVDAPWPEPVNPFPFGSLEAVRWALGAEQAELEDVSPDSWRDGGAGMDRGVLREIWAAEQGMRGSS